MNDRAEPISYRSARGRGLLLAAVLGSSMTFIDGSAVNVALPALQRSLNASLSELQWTVDAYALFLSAFLLAGGALGDRFGRRKLFVIGVSGFTVASVACGLAPTAALLVGARALQGLAAALLVPGSLSLLRASYREEDQGEAVGAWSGFSGVTATVGPLLGGWLIGVLSWRAIFFLNVPLAAVCLWATARFVPESRDDAQHPGLDWVGIALVTVGLGAVTFALIEGPPRHWPLWEILTGVGGAAALLGFVLQEWRARAPMVPLSIFRSGQFSGANLATLFVYAALSGSMFVTALQLQNALGKSPLYAGLVFSPTSLLLLLVSPRMAKLAQSVGYRWPLVVGSLLAAVGLGLSSFATPEAWGVTASWVGGAVLGVGLATLVAPLTMAVLSGASAQQSGLASGVNNAVSRVAGLLAIAVIPAATGFGHDGSAGYVRALLGCAALCLAGAVISLLMLRQPSAPGAPATPS